MEEDTIYRYFTCQTTEEEDKAILDWIKASKENEALFFELKQYGTLALNKKRRSMGFEAFIEQFEPAYRQSGKQPDKRSYARKYLYLWSSAAAIIAIILTLSIFYMQRPASLPMNRISNVFTDSVMQIKLTDGSTVWLNSGASLSYPAEFISDTREVKLKGNAFLR